MNETHTFRAHFAPRALGAAIAGLSAWACGESAPVPTADRPGMMPGTMPDIVQDTLPDPEQGRVRNGRVVCRGSDGQGQFGLFSFAGDGSDRQDLGPGGEVTWSRDGSVLWFISTEDHQLWRMDPEGNDRRRISSFPAGAGTPAASPDGSKVAVTSYTPGDDHPEIWVIDSDGSNARELTQTAATEAPRDGHELLWSVSPSWSADGRRIAFSSARGGSSQIWTMDADGGNPGPLTRGSGDGYPDCNVPQISRDGSGIVFWSGDETKSFGEIWVMDADGSHPRKLTETPDPRNSDNPSWSPDGASVIFISNRDGGRSFINAWVVSSSGGEPRIFAEDVSYCAWQPVP